MPSDAAGNTSLRDFPVMPAEIDRAALMSALEKQGRAFSESLTPQHQNLFSDAVVEVSDAHLAQMRAVIAAVEEVVKLPAFKNDAPHNILNFAKGVFYGYDFHLNAQGAHLIEINTNAGGAFLNVLLIGSQRESVTHGATVLEADPHQSFIGMFQNEWRLERGDAPLKTLVILDGQPESQFLYPEFILAKKLFEQAGFTALIADPADLQMSNAGVFCHGLPVDLIYNRLTDFELTHQPHLRAAWEKHQVVLTPNPAHYRRYADKRLLAQFTDGHGLRSAGVSQTSIDALLQGIPETRIVFAGDAETWWSERKQWFFKPVSGYGSKGAYRGDKLTKRVFEEIVQSDYVAQKLATPGEQQIRVEGGDIQSLKYDVRCYVYDGTIQLIAARLYQGQTTNFRTPGGGFALVRLSG